MRIFFSHKCMEYRLEGHPESPARIKSILKLTRHRFDFSEPEPCSDKDLLLCHEKELVSKVRHRKFSGTDTPNIPGIYEFSKLSVGSAIQAAEYTVKTGENSFSLSRPPGHHAGRNFMGGFCYFNSIAIAVKKALKTSDRIAIIDIDGHHGNGTEDIFLGSKDVLFISLHQKGAFPVSGFRSDRNCFNYPLAPGTNGKDYMKILGDALEKAEEFDPDLIAVSAGFDAYKNDPLLELELDEKTFFEAGDAIRQLNKPVFSVLEGGYSADVGKCACQFLKGVG